MTPQERKLVDDLFARLATLEQRPRDADAERAIADGMQAAPNAVYALVQTVLVQDEALRRADERIRELESGEAPPQQQQGGFLDSMREAIFSGAERRRGSVPPVRSGDQPMGVPPGFRTGNAQAEAGPIPQQEPGRGGSFLGTAAAAAAGVIGGALLLDSVRSMLGGHGAGGNAAAAGSSGQSASPWGDASSSDLAKEAGIDNVGQSGDRASFHDAPADPFDTADADADAEEDDFDFGDSDFA